MKSKIILFAATALLATTAANADEEEREGRYQSFLSCAAYHTIEASKSSGTAVDAQKALAVDYAEAATVFAPDGKPETANAALEKMLEDFKNKLDTGDPRDMAEQWTDLDFACNDLYLLKEGWVRERKKELEGSTTPP